MSQQWAVGIVGYVVAVNLLAYAAMAIDKARAISNSPRVPESALLRLAIIGGSIGIVAAQRTIRHKTRKEPFRSRLAGIVLLQSLVLLALAVGGVVAGSPERLWHFLVS